MTPTNRTLPSRETTSSTGSARAARSPARRRHASDFSDAVVAAYIHEISARNRHRRPTWQSDGRRVHAKR